MRGKRSRAEANEMKFTLTVTQSVVMFTTFQFVHRCGVLFSSEENWQNVDTAMSCPDVSSCFAGI